ncbi:hypothetical protein BKI52_15190 [marine bacterium AO1-C]|nr:hypothetical protein BKI52_15190 [marine bacterium AO1-C]
MKKIGILTLVISWISVGYTQTKQQIKESYTQIFSIEQQQYKGRTYYQKRVNELPKSHFLAKWVNTNQQYLYYLLTNFSSLKQSTLKQAATPEERQKLFIQALQKDKGFTQIMETFASQALAKPTQLPDTIGTNDLMNIAVKYFNIRKINAQDKYALKVCGGLNGIRATETKRSPQLEAFCFSTILRNFANPKSGLRAEVIKNAQKLYDLNLGVDKKDRLLRAQGALFMLMRNSETLQKILLKEYKTKQNTLPFVIKASKP